MGQGASSLEKEIGYTFRDKKLLTEAMSHDSLRARDNNLKDYQRFEHLGDAVISFVVTNYLFNKHPSYDEGSLSTCRASHIGQIRQRQIAEKYKLDEFVKFGGGVREFRRIDKFLEALIGAVFVDAGGEERGYPVVKRVIYKLWEFEEESVSSDEDDYHYDDDD